MPAAAGKGDERAPPAERACAPVTVLGLHALLLFDIVAHRDHLWAVQGLRAVVELAVAGIAVLAYLCTVLAEPGFLRSEPLPPPRRSLLARWLVAALAAPLYCLLALWRKAAIYGGGAGAGSRLESAIGGRERGSGADARELQTIGRSALDDVEMEGSDPGEELIDATDLEAGNLLGGSAASGAAGTGVGGLGGLGGPESKPSLGAVPGSPCPRGRRKRGEQAGPSISSSGSGRAVDAAGRRVVLQSGQRLRYCKVCHLHQPLRTKHCRDCDRCVRTHDHHCPWVGTCVGEGNRAYFYWFLVAQCLELTVFASEGFMELIGQGWQPSTWLEKAPLLVLGLVFMCLLLIMVSCLLSFHTYLAMMNMTTWENISWHNISYLRSLAPEEGSPFSGSVRYNLAVYCCTPEALCTPPELSTLKRTEDGWAIWELGQARVPTEVNCDKCIGGPLKGTRVNLCACFEVQ